MTWALVGELAAIFLASGLGATLFTAFVEGRWRNRQRADEAEYLAIQLAFLFEQYALDCADNTADDQLFRDSGACAGEQIRSLPVLPPLPESDSYKLLDRRLLNDVFEFPQRRALADRSAMFWWNVAGDQDAAMNAMRHKTVDLGVWAFDLADRLRSRYQLVPRDVGSGPWNPKKALQEWQKKIEESRSSEE